MRRCLSYMHSRPGLPAAVYMLFTLFPLLCGDYILRLLDYIEDCGYN